MLSKQVGILVLTFLVTVPCRAETTDPIIFNHTESVNPGQVLGLQGENFGSNPQVWLQIVTSAAPPTPTLQLTNILSKSNQFVSVEVPDSFAQGLYAVFVKNTTTGVFSTPKFVNRARPLGLLDTAVLSVRPSQNFRIHGRNLDYPGTNTAVKFRLTVSPYTDIDAVVTQGSDPYILQLATPSAGLVAGQTYNVIVNNGYGGSAGDSVNVFQVGVVVAGIDYWSLGVTWAKDFPFSTNVYNIKTGVNSLGRPALPLAARAVGDNVTNDGVAIAAAITYVSADAANGVQGGVLYFPAGTYRVDGQSIHMKSRVILQGAGMTQSIIYDNGSTVSSKNDLFTGTPSNIGVVDLAIECGSNGAFNTWDVGETGLRHFFLRSRFVTNRGKCMDHGASLALIDNCEIIHRAVGSNCPLDFTSRLHFIIRNSKIEWVHGRVPFLKTGYVQLENNVWSRSVERIVQNVQYGGPSFGEADNIVLLNNTFNKNPYLLNGDPTPVGAKIPSSNDGETLMNENVQYHGSGWVTGASDNTLEDTGTNSWNSINSKVGMEVTITEGRGMGQTRVITGSQMHLLTIGEPWDVIPDTTSQYAVNKPDLNYLVKGNLLEDVPRGIWLCYANPLRDVAIVGNTLTNGQAIYLRGDARDGVRMNVLTNIIVEGNTLESTVKPGYTTPWYPAQIIVDQGVYTGADNPGNPFYNVVVRDNSITIPISGGISGIDVGTGEGDGYYAKQVGDVVDDNGTAVFGVIFDHNTATNFTSRAAYNVNGGAVQTTIFNSVNNNVTKFLADGFTPGGTHSSIDTVTAWSANSHATPPYLWITALASSVTEGNPAKFRFSRSTTLGSLVVNYTKSANSANQTDYAEALGGTVTIPPTAQFVDVTMTPIHDSLVEGNETLTLSINDDGSYNIGRPNDTIKIVDPDMMMTSEVIGAISVQGSFGVNTSVYTLSGSGTTFASGSADNFRFAYNTLYGDGSITARVVSITGGNNVWNQVGVMVRESLMPGSRHMASLVRDGQPALCSRRAVTDLDATNSASSSITLPYWIRVTRAGNVLTAYRSADGVNWGNPIGTLTLSSPALASMVYIGLAVSSMLESKAATATFDNVKVVGKIFMPEVTIIATDGEGSEAGEVAEFSVTRTGLTTQPLTVNYAAGGTAAAGSDYQALSGSLVIPSGASGTRLTLTPIRDQSAEGSETVRISLTSSNDYLPTPPGEATVIIQDLPIDAWRVSEFGPNASNAVHAGNSADPDSDGILNLMEYALGLDPQNASSANLPIVTIETVNGIPHLTLTYPKLRSDILYKVEGSGDLDSWTIVPDETAGSENGIEFRRAAVPAGEDRKFLRLRAVYE